MEKPDNGDLIKFWGARMMAASRANATKVKAALSCIGFCIYVGC